MSMYESQSPRATSLFALASERSDRRRTWQAPEFLASEILALSKMNWNNTQFDGGQPITLRASRQVGSILKYCEGSPQSSYRYYM
jgi:hypothetical protein